MALLLQLRTLLWFGAIIVVVLNIGRWTARRLHWETADRVSQIAWNSALGLVVCGLVLAALGLCGALSSSVIQAATILGAVAGCLRFGHACKSSPAHTTIAVSLRADSVAEDECIPAWMRHLLLMLSVAAIATSLVSALAPPTAGDALCYHLELPKRYLQDGVLTHFPHNDNSTYPLLAEMWFLWGLAVDGPAVAQLMHWFCGLLLAGACYTLALPLLGRTPALVAACLTLLTPGINNQMTAPLNDVALALFTTLATAAFGEAVRNERFRGFVVAGLMLGGALSVKYTALVFVAAGGVTVGWAAWQTPQWRTMLYRGSAVALLTAGVVSGSWYARAAWHHGDPLYPFLSGGRSGNMLKGARLPGPTTFSNSKTPLGRHPSALLAAPWQMTMQPERFGGRGHQLGPLFLMLLPLLLLIPASQRSQLKPLPAVALLYGAACVLLRQNVRFLFPLVPLFATTAVAALSTLPTWPRLPKFIAAATVSIVVLFLAVVPVVRARHHLLVSLGLETREAYLIRQEPTAAVAAWANRELTADAHILSQEQRAFYLDAPLTRENIFRRRFPYERIASLYPGSLSRMLRAGGFTHLLLAEGRGSNAGLYDATLSRAVDLELATAPDAAPLPLAEFVTSTADGATRRYRVFALR